MRLSRTCASNLQSIGFSKPSASQAQGLQDLLKIVQSLQLNRCRYDDIEREAIVGEGEMFLVERCVGGSEVAAI